MLKFSNCFWRVDHAWNSTVPVPAVDDQTSGESSQRTAGACRLDRLPHAGARFFGDSARPFGGAGPSAHQGTRINVRPAGDGNHLLRPSGLLFGGGLVGP